MKHLKFLFPVLLCTLLLGLSSCKETNADRLRAMRGDWESIKNRPAFTPVSYTHLTLPTTERV